MDKKIEMEEMHVVSDLETLKVLSDPFRMDILRIIALANKVGELRTVKQLADELDLPPTKLYYHIKLLEKHNLIIVADTQVVSGIIEKKYRIIADDITVDKNILETEEGPSDEQLEQLLESIGNIYDLTYLDLKKSLKTIFLEKVVEKEGGPPAREQISLHIQSDDLLLTREQTKAFTQKFKDLFAEFDQLSEENLKAKTDEHLFFGMVFSLVPHYHRTTNPSTEEPKE